MAECEHPKERVVKKFRGELLCLKCEHVIGYWRDDAQVVLPMRQVKRDADPES